MTTNKNRKTNKPADPSDVSQALERASGYLARRPLLVEELRARLLRTGFTEDATSRAVEQLQQWGYLDDEKVLEARAERAARPKDRGVLRLASVLHESGVSEDDALSKAAVHLPPEVERERVRYFLEQRFADRQNPGKAARMLASRGFSEEVITSEIEAFFEL